ncbi:hypothetical protein [Agarivorans gilvus]|uniref:Uncharacterized protein n=1 Tax=Agarivorans gilvus TaxID=680279 RepID=A0ABQ1I8H8_9ALTE|nr:hypothetical protein [Agarivorans gilvus]GGB21612.1 hypothetical protein GCM10007414_38750 [Agarivorans gilvus]
MSNSPATLDQDDRENLQYILTQMFPESKTFKQHAPTVRTLEVYIQAVRANKFCNNAMTHLTTELLATPASQLYRGKMKAVVKKAIKEIKNKHQNTGLSFFICEQAVKLRYKSPLAITLDGYMR